jgi:hypothetical protein
MHMHNLKNTKGNSPSSDSTCNDVVIINRCLSVNAFGLPGHTTVSSAISLFLS